MTIDEVTTMTNASDSRNRVNEQDPNDSYSNILENIRGFGEELMQWDGFVPAIEEIIALGMIFAHQDRHLTFIVITYATINRIIRNRLSSQETYPPIHTISAQFRFHAHQDQQALQPTDGADTRFCFGKAAAQAA